MNRLKLTVEYDGTEFHGFQKQGHLRTVQGELEAVLARVTRQSLPVVGASRTDAGVHARGQVVHVDIDETVQLPLEKWVHVLNRGLPPDLAVRKAERTTGDFHARFTARWKWYRYSLVMSRPSAFAVRYAARSLTLLDTGAMQAAAQLMVGERDFSSFCSTRAQQESKVRTIFAVDVARRGERGVIFDVRGNAFLHNMVRIMVGTLVQVGRGLVQPDAVQSILDDRDRRRAGPTAPAHGLCLWHIEYGSRDPSAVVSDIDDVQIGAI